MLKRKSCQISSCVQIFSDISEQLKAVEQLGASAVIDKFAYGLTAIDVSQSSRPSKREQDDRLKRG